MNDLSEYRLSHLFVSQNTDYFSLCVVSTHFFVILVMPPSSFLWYKTSSWSCYDYHSRKPHWSLVWTSSYLHISQSNYIEWYFSLFLFLFILESNSERKEQWIRSIGTLNNIIFGEYQVFILPLSIYKQRSSIDVSYLNNMGISFLLFDSIFLFSSLSLISFIAIKNSPF